MPQFKQPQTILREIARDRRSSSTLRLRVAKMLSSHLPKLGPYPVGSLRVLWRLASEGKTPPRQRLEALELLIEDRSVAQRQASENLASRDRSVGVEEQVLQALLEDAKSWPDPRDRFARESFQKSRRLNSSDFDPIWELYCDLVTEPFKSEELAKLLGEMPGNSHIDRLIARYPSASRWLQSKILETVRRFDEAPYTRPPIKAKISEFLKQENIPCKNHPSSS